MIKKILVLALLIGINIFANEFSVKFEVTSELPDKDSKIYIVGNNIKLGEWNPSKIILEKVSHNKWVYSATFTKNDALEFKFTLGSWNTEALNEDGSTPGNYNITVSSDTIIKFNIRNWKSSSAPKAEKKITGTLIYHKGFHWDGLKDRDIIVWLPPNYKKNLNARYPVLYMHDGQNVFDPSTASFGNEWNADETADSLIKQNKIKEIIIVAINNTPDRMIEYLPTELGKKYMEFVVKKVKPFIDGKYRTLKDQKNTATIGSSAGGLISFMLSWEYPKVFGMAGCLSPAFKIEQIDYVQNVLNYNGRKKDLKIYVDNGGIALESRLRPGIDDMLTALNQKGYKNSEDINVYFDLKAEHNEKAWSKRLWRPLTFFFKK